MSTDDEPAQFVKVSWAMRLIPRPIFTNINNIHPIKKFFSILKIPIVSNFFDVLNTEWDKIDETVKELRIVHQLKKSIEVTRVKKILYTRLTLVIIYILCSKITLVLHVYMVIGCLHKMM